ILELLENLTGRAADQSLRRETPEIAKRGVDDGRPERTSRFLEDEDAVARRFHGALQASLAQGQGPLEAGPHADIRHCATDRVLTLVFGPFPCQPYLERPGPTRGQEAADLARRLAARSGLSQDLQDAEKIVSMDELGYRPVAQGVLLHPDHPGQGGVGVGDALVLKNEDTVTESLHEAAVAFFRFTQPRLQRLLGREITRGQQHR